MGVGTVLRRRSWLYPSSLSAQLVLLAGKALAEEQHQVRTDLFPAILEKLKNDADLQSISRRLPGRHLSQGSGVLVGRHR